MIKCCDESWIKLATAGPAAITKSVPMTISIMALANSHLSTVHHQTPTSDRSVRSSIGLSFLAAKLSGKLAKCIAARAKIIELIKRSRRRCQQDCAAITIVFGIIKCCMRGVMKIVINICVGNGRATFWQRRWLNCQSDRLFQHCGYAA